MSSSFLRIVRLGFGLLGLLAVSYQFYASTSRPGFNPVNYFSYFTILSNLFLALVLLITASSNKMFQRATSFRGAAALYMTITGIVYFVLLRGLEESLQTPIPWVNTVLHYVMPLVGLLDWLLIRSPSRLSRNQFLSWLLFPLLYLVYSLIRGSLTGFYPYPFLNASKQGVFIVTVSCLVIMITFIAVGSLLRWWNKRRYQKS
ncbi:Pr6Pr family membrane protein [Exiguobacterium artemiae]|uniref:Pr6Pr family membrane protein n=1 Tax=Exiguobacterium artemiae TaxID=340145 RepID=UPI003D01A921